MARAMRVLAAGTAALVVVSLSPRDHAIAETSDSSAVEQLVRTRDFRLIAEVPADGLLPGTDYYTGYQDLPFLESALVEQQGQPIVIEGDNVCHFPISVHPAAQAQQALTEVYGYREREVDTENCKRLIEVGSISMPVFEAAFSESGDSAPAAEPVAAGLTAESSAIGPPAYVSAWAYSLVTEPAYVAADLAGSNIFSNPVEPTSEVVTYINWNSTHGTECLGKVWLHQGRDSLVADFPLLSIPLTRWEDRSWTPSSHSGCQVVWSKGHYKVENTFFSLCRTVLNRWGNVIAHHWPTYIEYVDPPGQVPPLNPVRADFNTTHTETPNDCGFALRNEGYWTPAPFADPNHNLVPPFGTRN